MENLLETYGKWMKMDENGLKENLEEHLQDRFYICQWIGIWIGKIGKFYRNT